MNNERRQKLMESLKSFNKSQKDKILDFAINTKDLEVISTGIKRVDDFLGGGTKRGTFTILWGGFSVGKTTLALQQIAHAQKQGMIVCYINLEKPIDQSRFEQFGIKLDELVLANHTKNAEQALTIIRKLCKDKVVDLIVLDSLNAMAPKGELESKGGKERDLEEKNIAELARVMSEFCRKVNPDIYRAKASVVIIGQIRIGGIGTFFTRATLSGGEAIKFYAYNMVFMRKGQKADSPVKKFKEYFICPDQKIRYSTVKDAVGFDVCMRMNKTNSASSARENEEIHLPFIFDKGFVSSIEESDDISVRIDSTLTEIQRKEIEKYLIQNKSEEAKLLGLIKKGLIQVHSVNPTIALKQTEIIEKPVEPTPPPLRELTEGSQAPVKRGRGRPKKDKK